MRSTSLFVIIVLWSLFAARALYKQTASLFSWDAFGYHLYLPAFFIDHDPLLKDLDRVEARREAYGTSGTLYQVTRFPNGGHIPRYTMGQAVLWSPWFLAGHALALATGAVPDGYSTPYQVAVATGVLLYLLLGLLALRQVLLHFFSEGITAMTLFLLLAGSNLIDQVENGLSMPHVQLFALHAGILFYTLRWTTERHLRHAVPLAILMGLGILVRPTEAVCLLIPIFWRGPSEAVAPWRRVFDNRLQWGVIIGILLVIGLPQFLYWKAATGHWVVDPYDNPAEGLDLLSPHTMSFLFSFRKGWFLYTPMMLVAILGLVQCWRIRHPAFLPVLLFLVVDLWVVSSWTNWWYAGSFSSRAMLSAYPALTLPLAAVVAMVVSWRVQARWAGGMILSALVVLNLFQHWQYDRGIIHPSRMSREAYVAIFGRISEPPGFANMLLIERHGPTHLSDVDLSRYRAVDLDPTHITRPISDQDTLVVDHGTGQMRRCYQVGEGFEFTPPVRIPYSSLTRADHVWVLVTWHVFVHALPVQGGFVHQMEHKGRSYGYFVQGFDKMELVPEAWNTITTRYLTPEVRQASDQLMVFYWAMDGAPVLVDGPHISLLEPLRGY